MTDRNSLSPRTLLAQAMHYLDDKTGAIVPPIYTSTTYARDADYELTGGYQYTREKNPTDAPAERLIARLEGGADAKLFASGLSAATDRRFYSSRNRRWPAVRLFPFVEH